MKHFTAFSSSKAEKYKFVPGQLQSQVLDSGHLLMKAVFVVHFITFADSAWLTAWLELSRPPSAFGPSFWKLSQAQLSQTPSLLGAGFRV